MRQVLEPTSAQTEGWQAIRSGNHTLIAAPTGSGKTLAAFLTALDQLLRESLEQGDLPDEVRVIYVSPLKALSARHSQEPRRAAPRDPPRWPRRWDSRRCGSRAAVRSGDTPQTERAAMLRTPPHILVTTPESLYLLLTAERARRDAADRAHGDRRRDPRRGRVASAARTSLSRSSGSIVHADASSQRIGLSATQKPIEEVARFLVGRVRTRRAVDRRPRSSSARSISRIEVPPASPLEAVMSDEVWEEIYDRLVELVEQHRTTLIFVNTRRLAERMARHLAERLGAERVAAHHGSLSKETRLDAEERLQAAARLKVLVATASLELGIDIGHVDLVVPDRHRRAASRRCCSGSAAPGTPCGGTAEGPAVSADAR